MTAIASALRAGGSMAFPISERSSSTCTTILRILLAMAVPCARCAGASALAVPFADVRGFQSADARMHARPGAHHEDVHDLVGQRRTRHAHFHGVEVAAHVDRVD